MDVQACLKQGAIGALGAIPGTMLAHPFDVLKIRMQTGGASALGLAYTSATASVGVRGLYQGLLGGLQQKVLTRGPMFLASEAGTQLCEVQLGLSRTPAVFLGSLGSGYVTGSLAALAEWRKVLGATASAGAQQKAHGPRVLLQQASNAGQLRSVGRRLHGAGVRNAIFDGVFFGTSSTLRQWPGFSDSPAVCYASAASAAVVLDYAVDVSVKRNMAVGPTRAVHAGASLPTAHYDTAATACTRSAWSAAWSLRWPQQQQQ
jgi:hypothetical protein